MARSAARHCVEAGLRSASWAGWAELQGTTGPSNFWAASLEPPHATMRTRGATSAIADFMRIGGHYAGAICIGDTILAIRRGHSSHSFNFPFSSLVSYLSGGSETGCLRLGSRARWVSGLAGL